jgi:hypothetical protein
MGRVVAYVITIFLSMAVFGAAADIGVTIATGQGGTIAGGLGGLAGLVIAIVGLNLYFSAKQGKGGSARQAGRPGTPTDTGSATHVPVSIDPSNDEQAKAGTPATRLADVLGEPAARPGTSSDSKEEGAATNDPPPRATPRDPAHADLWAMIDERMGRQ